LKGENRARLLGYSNTDSFRAKSDLGTIAGRFICCKSIYGFATTNMYHILYNVSKVLTSKNANKLKHAYLT
jgi:hypothetical protein